MEQPLRLTKDAPRISLEKSATLSGEMRINLNWSQPEQKKGFWASLAGPSSIDLDLGCLVELDDGTVDVVQALGNSFGSLKRAPFMRLDGDDRSGQNSAGENVTVNLDKISSVARFLIFAFIYEGAPSWNVAKGVVTIYPPSGSPIVVNLDTYETRNMCAIAMVTVKNGQLSIEREVKYFDGHADMDYAYDWGISWVPGTKD